MMGGATTNANRRAVAAAPAARNVMYWKTLSAPKYS